LSDLHIDNGDKFGTSGMRTTAFLQNVEILVQNYQVDQVFLNGDVLDLYRLNLNEGNVNIS
jgi:metallophosphoesterase superfamily enzyme